MKRHHPAAKTTGQALEFSSKEFISHEKNQFWYIGIGLLILVSIYLALKYHDYLLSAVALAVGVAVFRVARLEPNHRAIKINEKGVYWGTDFIAYHQLRCFWASEAGEHTMIYLDRLNLSTTISFDIPDSRLDETVAYLSNHLPWHDHRTEPVSDRLSRFLKV